MPEVADVTCIEPIKIRGHQRLGDQGSNLGPELLRAEHKPRVGTVVYSGDYVCIQSLLTLSPVLSTHIRSL